MLFLSSKLFQNINFELQGMPIFSSSSHTAAMNPWLSPTCSYEGGPRHGVQHREFNNVYPYQPRHSRNFGSNTPLNGPYFETQDWIHSLKIDFPNHDECIILSED